jgi:hypothetical protein
MKRQLFLVAAVITTANCFAYYDDYSSSPSTELPDWLTFAGFLMIAWGILEIILFFKIWGMTNDIRALKNDHFNQTTNEIPSGQLVNDIRKKLLLGDIDKVKKALLMKFTDDVKHSYWKMPVQGYEKDQNGKDHMVSYKERNLKKPITFYVENLRKQFEKIGEPLPPYINHMATYGDFFNLFTEEDLIAMHPIQGK